MNIAYKLVIIGPNIEIDKYFIKINLDRGLVVTIHVPKELQIADIFTKLSPHKRFQ